MGFSLSCAVISWDTCGSFLNVNILLAYASIAELIGYLMHESLLISWVYLSQITRW